MKEIHKILTKKRYVLFKMRYNSALTKLGVHTTNNKIGKINLVDCSLLYCEIDFIRKIWRGNYKNRWGCSCNRLFIDLLDALIILNKIFNSTAGFNKKTKSRRFNSLSGSRKIKFF